MGNHSFTFEPTWSEVEELVKVVSEVSMRPEFKGRIISGFQCNGGQWFAEIVAPTGRSLMEFTASVYMELPTEESQWATSEERQDVISDGPLSFSDAVETASDEEVDEDGSDDGDSGTAVYSEEADEAAYIEHEKAAGRPAPPKKLKKPASVGKTSNAAITVEED
jgi:hypothetical protein